MSDATTLSDDLKFLCQKLGFGIPWAVQATPWNVSGRVIEAMRERGYCFEIHVDCEVQPWVRCWKMGADAESDETGDTVPHAILAAAREALAGGDADGK